MSDPFPAYFFNGRESTTCFREAVLSPASRYARFSGFWGPAGVREGASRSEGIWAVMRIGSLLPLSLLFFQRRSAARPHDSAVSAAAGG